MVFTFLVDADFSVSAKLLDYKRLGCQRKEGLQILNIIDNWHKLSEVFNIPIRTVADLKNIYIKYINTQDTIYRLRIREKVYYYSLGNYRGVSKVSKISEIPELSTSIKYGFMFHPIVLGWIFSAPALRMYINAHIQEWKARGYVNNMPLFPQEDYVCPWWICDYYLYHHRCLLVAKNYEYYKYVFPTISWETAYNHLLHREWPQEIPHTEN